MEAGPREWVGLGLLALVALIVSMDLTLLHLAVPALSADLRPSGTELLWITDVYGFMIAGFLVTMGTLGDIVGRRRLLLVGSVAFACASVLAAFSTSATMLIASRAALGVAGATLAPSTLSLLRTMFTVDRQRSVAITVWFTAFLIGGAIGPLVGGAMLEVAWWGSVFLLAVPVTVAVVVAGPRILPEHRHEGDARLDVPSVALSLGTVLPVVYGFKRFAESGVDVLSVASVVAGVVLGVVFVRRQRTLEHPLLDLRLLANPMVSIPLTTMTLSLTVMMGVQFLIAQYLQLVLGLTPLPAGLWTLPMAVAGVLASLATTAFGARLRPSVVIGAGFAVAAVGFALLTRLTAESGVGLVVAATCLVFIGFAPGAALGTDLMVTAAPPEKAGTVSAMSETTQEFGGAIGIAVLGSVAAIAYRSHLDTNLPPGTPPAAAEAARETLGNAATASADLPHPLGTDLLDTARDAFTNGLQLNGAIAAALTLLMATAAVLVLRRQPAA